VKKIMLIVEKRCTEENLGRVVKGEFRVDGKSHGGAVGGKHREGAVGGKPREGAVGEKTREGAVEGKPREGAVEGKPREGAVEGKPREPAVGKKPKLAVNKSGKAPMSHKTYLILILITEKIDAKNTQTAKAVVIRSLWAFSKRSSTGIALVNGMAKIVTLPKESWWIGSFPTRKFRWRLED